METMIIIIAVVCGVAAAFWIGRRIGYDRGYCDGSDDMQTQLKNIYEEGKKEREKIEKEINPDCGWK